MKEVDSRDQIKHDYISDQSFLEKMPVAEQEWQEI